MKLRAGWKRVLWLIANRPIAIAYGKETIYTRDQVSVNWQTAEALERRGLLTINRQIDADGYKASWDLTLTEKGREAARGGHV